MEMTGLDCKWENGNYLCFILDYEYFIVDIFINGWDVKFVVEIIKYVIINNPSIL